MHLELSRCPERLQKLRRTLWRSHTLSTNMRMRFSGAGDYEVSGDHSYRSNATYRLSVVPVSITAEKQRVLRQNLHRKSWKAEEHEMRLKGERSHV